ncbi:MAG: hypothetical protein OZ921_13345 [Sorangiineae bacterium]|nr:hypothetical protein [Polyangiaceae bacterium]MEB2323490.1 hypothetical protein [Sorangiineae bacterium]
MGERQAPLQARTALVAAIVAGACLGALAAVWLAERAPTAERLETTLAPAPSPLEGDAEHDASSPTPRAGEPPGAPAGLAHAAPSAPEAGAPEAIDTTIRRCAWGDPAACLAAAGALERAPGAEADGARIFELRRRARTLDVQACVRARDPRPCERAARLLAAGIGGPANPKESVALGERARELCAARGGASCDGGR